MEKEQEEYECLFHWLKNLYEDFLKERVAGETIPCVTCQRLKECKTSPLVVFNTIGDKYGLRVK